MYFKQFKLVGMGCASYLIGSEQTGEAAVIDPGWNVEVYVQEAQAQNLRITSIFETHLHADHVSGNRRLAASTGATIYLHKQAKAAFPYQPLEGGSVVELGELRIKVLHTPGHTWESISLLVEDTTHPSTPPRLISGDTLFVGDVGRPDFAGQEGAGTLFDSLQREIVPLPDNTEVYPGHLAGSLCGRSLSDATMSTITNEKRTNPALQIGDRAAFVTFLTADLPPEPPDFRRIVELNRAGSPETQPTLPELSWEELQAKLAEGAQLVDMREPDAFWEAHLSGAYNVPLGLSQFGATTAALVPAATPIVLLASSVQEIEQAQTGLGVVGRYNLLGYVLFDKVATYAQASEDKRVDGSELAAAVVLDVREPGEYNVDGLTGALNIPLRQIPRRLTELEAYKNDRLVVVCASGYRSSAAASYLEKAGWSQLSNLKGGMEGLKLVGAAR